jgi:hypothetical protein
MSQLPSAMWSSEILNRYNCDIFQFVGLFWFEVTIRGQSAPSPSQPSLHVWLSCRIWIVHHPLQVIAGLRC